MVIISIFMIMMERDYVLYRTVLYKELRLDPSLGRIIISC